MNFKFRFGKCYSILIVCLLCFAAEMVEADSDREVDDMEKLEDKKLEDTQKTPNGFHEVGNDDSEEIDDDTESGDDIKRHIGSLARFNKYPWAYRRNSKRFIGSLAAKGYLPSGKRFLGSLAAKGYLPSGKRFIGSLAAKGNLPGKRYIGTLAAKGYLPGKRFIGSLAQNGNLRDKKFIGSLAAKDSLPGKRFLGSLAAKGHLPGKRFLGSLAANSNLPGKRYLASLVAKGSLRPFYRRDDDTFDFDPEDENVLEEEEEPSDWEYTDNSIDSQRFKRHIGAIARSNAFPSIYGYRRGRRSDEVAYPLPHLSENMYYDIQDGGDEEKRFLGSLARGGWFPRQFRGYMFNDPPEKRHIGSLAKLGWLPYIRSYRRNPSSGKRNIQSIARNGYLNQHYGKRSSGAVGTEDSISSYKRNDDAEEDTPQVFDKFSMSSPLPQRRHVGSIARLGYLRYGKRFPDADDVVYIDADDSHEVEDTDGKSDDILFEADTPYIESDSQEDLLSDLHNSDGLNKDKRYLLLPAVDKILLRRLYSRSFGKRDLYDFENEH